VAVTVNGAVLTAAVALGASPQNLTWTSPTLTAGDVVVLVVDMNAASANFPASATPTGGTGLSWTSIVVENNTAAHFSSVRVWWTNVPTTHTPASIVTSISATGTSVSAQGALYRLTGADTVTPIGASIGVFQGRPTRPARPCRSRAPPPGRSSSWAPLTGQPASQRTPSRSAASRRP
jgi:hypothetical protein